MTYREAYATQQSSPKSLRDRKDHKPIKSTLKSFLHRHRPPPTPPNQDRDSDHGREQEGGATGLDKGKVRRGQDERGEGTSSGSSSHSGSPGGGGATVKDSLLEEEEEEERRTKARGRRGISQIYPGDEQERVTELNTSQGTLLGSGSGEVGVAPISRGYGRSDSLGRGLKPNYSPLPQQQQQHHHHQLKRYPSNDSMSSSSTLVSKLNYEHVENVADILRSATGPYGIQGLTQSNVQDHGRRTRHRHRHNQQQQQPSEEEEGGGVYEYARGKRKEKFAPAEEGQINGRAGGEGPMGEGPGSGRRGNREEEENCEDEGV